MGVRIGHLSKIAPAVFRVCNKSGWEELSDKHLVIDLQAHTCIAVNDSVLPDADLIVVCALEPLIDSLKSDLLNGQENVHAPTSVSRSKGSRSLLRGRR